MIVAEGADPTDIPDGQASALLLALDPHGFGGITVRSRAGPVRDHWLGKVRALLPAAAPWRRLQAGTAVGQLDDGLDLAATLAHGRAVIARGILSASKGGLIVLPMAERLPQPMAARLAAALDTEHAEPAAGFGLVALDEGVDEEEVCSRLRDRLAFWTDLSGYDPGYPLPDQAGAITEARERLRRVTTPDPQRCALAEAAAALGIDSMRAIVLAQRAARGAAALAGRDSVTSQDAALAARLVLAPRATRLPASPEAEPKREDSPAPERRAEEQRSTDGPEESMADRELSDLVVAAAKAALPADLLARLQAGAGRTSRQAPGRSGATQAGSRRGRPIGVRRNRGSEPRMSIIETLRAAAPWQSLRHPLPDPGGESRRVAVRKDDFRFIRFKQRTETVTVFAVDASGSLAMHRLAEAKGAVELLLAECYVRRDQVALLAFRGNGADLLLPPTRSLARAKRCLAGLAGGGGTPLAGAIDAAMSMAEQVRRHGRTPVIVFLTDGRANVARDGAVGRVAAEADARSAALVARSSGIQMLLVDAAQRPQPQAQALAAALGATYVPLPRAEAATLTAAVRAMTMA